MVEFKEHLESSRIKLSVCKKASILIVTKKRVVNFNTSF